MSASTKKGGALGLSQKSDGLLSSTPSKGDSLSTTPSKSSKHGVTKKSSGAKGGDSQVTNPAILNQQALEALYSATYVEDFIDCNDNMSDDLIRQTTRMFEMGSNYMTYIRELESAMTILLGEDEGHQIIPDQFGSEKKKAVFRLQQVLMTAQDTGDDSLQVMQSIQDHIENKTRQLDVDRKNLAEFCKEQDIPESTFKDPPPPPTERNIKRARRVARPEIYRPSILGPSSLKATSYPETVSNNLRDHQDTHVVTAPSRFRDRDRGDRSERGGRGGGGDSGSGGDSQKESSSTSSKETPTASTAAAASASGGASVPTTSADVPPPPPITTTTANEEHVHKPNGRSERTSERSGGSSSRHSATSAAASAAADHATEKSEKSERGNSNSGYSSSSSKKQSHKNQTTQETKKTKKRKAKQSSSNNSKDDNSPQQYAIDPDEPTYCLCDQVSYGEMIGCDNDLCPIEWFHFSCVSLTTKPKGKWYCPKCRGDRPNVMKPKAIFLKELEKYNREKEEKA